MFSYGSIAFIRQSLLKKSGKNFTLITTAKKHSNQFRKQPLNSFQKNNGILLPKKPTNFYNVQQSAKIHLSSKKNAIPTILISALKHLLKIAAVIVGRFVHNFEK
jgi:hypothetical protein